MNFYSTSNFQNLWGENYVFHSLQKNNKCFLVIIEKNESVTDGTNYYLDFCTHNSFEEANETLYRLCFSNDYDEALEKLLLHSGRGGSSSFNFYCKIISRYTQYVLNENKKRSCVNLLICNNNGMKNIIDFCTSKNFITIGSCLSFRPSNYISIKKRSFSV